MKKYLAFMAIIMMSSAPVSSFAQETAVEEPDFSEIEEKHPRIKRYHEYRRADMPALDLNHDGVLQYDELINSIPLKFSSADLNGDGQLTADEQTAMSTKFEEEKGEMYEKSTERKLRALDRRLRMMDDNEDDIVTMQEYTDFFTRRYYSMDQNGDGIVDVSEYRTDVESIPKRYIKQYEREQGEDD